MRLEHLGASRHGERLREIVWNEFSTATDDLGAIGGCLRTLEHQRHGWEPDNYLGDWFEGMFKSGVERDRAVALQDLALAANSHLNRKDSIEEIKRLKPYAEVAIQSSAYWAQFAGAWALAWIAESTIDNRVDLPSLRRLLNLWLTSSSKDVKDKAAWAFAVMAPLPRSGVHLWGPE